MIESGLLGLHVGLYKEGSGILRLTGADTYAGATIAGGGVLAVDGTVAGDAYALGTNSGTLTGGDTALTTVLDVNGNRNSFTGSVLAGTATLTGSRIVPVAGYLALPGQTYTYLTAGTAITGNITDNKISPVLTYTGTVNGTTASFTAKTTGLGSLAGLADAPRSVLAALDTTALTAFATDPASTTAHSLLPLYYGSDTAIRGAGKATAATERANLLSLNPLSTMTAGAVYNRLDTARSEDAVPLTVPLNSVTGQTAVLSVGAPMTLDDDNHLWFKLLRGFEMYEGTGGAYDLHNQSFGGLVSYGKTDYTTDVLSGRSHDWRVGIYASHDNGTWKTQGLLSYGQNRYDLDRSDYFGTYQSDYKANIFDISARTKYLPRKNRDKSWQAAPYMGLAYTHNSQGAYTETGTGCLPQSMDSAGNSSLRAEVGVEFKHAMSTDSSLGGSLGYKRVLSGVNPELNGTFAGTTAPFTLQGDNDRNYVTYSVNLQQKAGHDWTVQGGLRGEMSAHSHSEIYSVTAKYAF